MAGHWFETILDNTTGRPVSGATVKVYTAAATIVGDAVTAGTFATIFSDDGVTSIDQASASYVTTDSRGFAQFWTNETSVALEISFGGEAKKAISDVEIIGGTVASDVTTLAARVDKHDTVFGLAANAVDLGTFTGATITSSSSVKTALQELETAVESVSSATDPLVISIAALSDPNADRILFWDDSAGDMAWLTASTGLSVSGTNLTVDATTVKPTESLIIACSDETTAITTGTAKVAFRMPYAFTLSAVRASVTTAPTGANLVIDINEAGTTILSTKLSIDATEKTSTTAATAAVISDASLADDAEITIDFDTVGSTIAGAGVKVYLIGTRT